MQPVINSDLEKIYQRFLTTARTHYENFPVISLFTEPKKRKYIAAFYTFARMADDIADEGENTDDEKLILLDKFESELSAALNNDFKNEFWLAITDTIHSNNLSEKYFYDLIKAFRQDLLMKRYNTFEDVLNYCVHSANPVGRIILEFYNIRDEKAKIFSDKICTALQLINFWQDVSIDVRKNRIYIPLNDIKTFDTTEKNILDLHFGFNEKKLIQYEVEKTREMMLEGRGLLSYLRGRLYFQIKWTISGGIGILNKIEQQNYNVFDRRPKLTKFDFLKLLVRNKL